MSVFFPKSILVAPYERNKKFLIKIPKGLSIITDTFPSPKEDTKKIDKNFSIETNAINNPYLKYASEAIEVAYKRFPKAGINRVDISQRFNFSPDDLVPVLRTFGMILRELEGNKSSKILSKLIENLDSADCELLVNYSIGYMTPRYQDINFECMFLSGHVILCIGRPKSSNPKNIRTWGATTLLCDLWSKRVYLAADFEKLRSQTPDIRFYGLDRWNNLRSTIIANDWNKSHYLDGSPEIYVGPANEKYDRALVAMVKEDELRLAKIQKEIIPQKTENFTELFDLDTGPTFPLPTLAEKVKIFDINNQKRTV